VGGVRGATAVGEPVRPAAPRRWGGRALGTIQLAASVGVLLVTLSFADREQILARLGALDPGWALAGVAVVSVQLALMAARWRSIALTLGVPLGYRRALSEYYVSTLLNQVMPFGILGDALRAVRHARRLRESGTASVASRQVVLAIVLERASGQLALCGVALLLMASWWSAIAPALPVRGERGLLLPVATMVGVTASLALVLRDRRFSRFRELLKDSARVLFAAGQPIHWLVSVALIFAHVALFCCAARAIGSSLDFVSALRIVPLVMLAATLPAFFAGWGVREAAAAWLFHAIGSTATQGVAVSLVYGSLTLIATTPGIWALRAD
jgi:glycosyltransferase 2 family protein